MKHETEMTQEEHDHWEALAETKNASVVESSDLLGADLIKEERRRQIEGEGWTPEHDDQHHGGELADAAACYALSSTGLNQPRDYKKLWPWEESWWRPSESDPVKDLVKAGALIAAEIDRLNRQKAKAPNAEASGCRSED